ncbi:3979_t:CDS:1, partial [Scutellospora calospora]
MNRNFIFAFILLATLSMVYAQRYKRRDDIPSICSPDEVPLKLAFSPSPMNAGSSVEFTVVGELATEVPTGSVINGAFYNNDHTFIDTFGVDFCAASQGINCPIPAGVEFRTVFNITASKDLPSLF